MSSAHNLVIIECDYIQQRHCCKDIAVISRDYYYYVPCEDLHFWDCTDWEA